MAADKLCLSGSFPNTPCISCAGGVIMCRRNVLLGWIAAAFGLGLLCGLWIQEGFFVYCIGFALLIYGFCGVFKK